VGPDLLAIEDLIAQQGEAEVQLAWACFATNPAPHCKPPDDKDATMFPVTVFLKYFDSYVEDSRAVARAYVDEKARGGWNYPEEMQHLINYKSDLLPKP
jgi:hypothetical protein